jgi:pimeloyl-ACP methyl ester carboxylesterase
MKEECIRLGDYRRKRLSLKERSMNRTLGAVLFLSILLIGCRSFEHRSNETMQVKMMHVNGTDLSYVEQGQGETVVFIHGAIGDWRNWEEIRPFISGRYHFVSLSLRYHYPNKWSDDGRNYTMTQHVEDVAQFIRALNVGKVHLVGNSYGGRLAGYIALKYPELLRSVAMGDPAIIAPESAEGKAAVAEFRKDAEKSSAAAKAGNEKESIISFYNAILKDPDAFRKAIVTNQQRVLDNARMMVPYWEHAQQSALAVTCEQLGSLKVPALIVTGEHSRSNFQYGNKTLLGCLPVGVETAVVPGGTHMWFSDNPEAAAKAILAFIDRH